MAQTWRDRRAAPKAAAAPLDKRGLEDHALAYVARYATTRAKLAAYLDRKLDQRGWREPEDRGQAVAALVERFAQTGYVDDRAFADQRAAALGRRGYGARRVDAALRAAGIADEDAGSARESARDGAFEAALAYARRRHVGPYARAAMTPDEHRRAMAAMLRAGHEFEIARRVLATAPEEPGPAEGA